MPVTYDTATIAVLGDVTKRVESLPTAPKDSAALSAKLQEKLDLMKSDFMKRDLQIWLRKTYPRTVDEWVTKAVGMYNATIKQLKSRYATSNMNAIVQFAGTDLVPFDYLDQYSGATVKPVTYYLNGTPTSDSFEGNATNGDYLVDTLHKVLYINRSTSDATVDWQRYSSDDLIDRFLSYTPLKIPHVTGAVWLALQDGSLKLRSSQSGNDKVDEAAAQWKEYYDEDLKKATQLLDIDESGDGIISSYEASVSDDDQLIW